MGAIALAKVTLASQVSNGATFTVPYPAGVTQAMLLASTGGVMVVNADGRFSQGGSPGFTVSFGATDATVTQNTGAALPAGTVIDISFGDTQQNGRYETGSRVRGVTALTAATGTASDTIADAGGSYTQATLNNNFKSLADKINELRSAMVSAGLLNG